MDIQNLSIEIGAAPAIKILNGINLAVDENEIVALVGGSGSGKTTTGLAVLRLLEPAMRVTQGGIIFQGKDLLANTERQMRSLRGAQISMVFQDPLSAFNPVFTIGFQIDESLRFHAGLSARLARKRTMELLDIVGVPDQQRIYNSYPHQLSGGMRQRAMIALAVAVQPRLIIADEPTSNLDVTLQARILELFGRLRTEMKISILLITHDLGVVRHLTDRIYVMSGGKILETGPTREVLSRPANAYTEQLLKAVAF